MSSDLIEGERNFDYGRQKSKSARNNSPDINTGNLGLEGNAAPVANVVAAMQQAQRSGNQSGYRWRDENGCVWGNMPAGSYTGSGC